MAENKKYTVAKKFRVRETGKIFEVGQAANQFSNAKTEEYLERGLIEVDKAATKAANEDAPKKASENQEKEPKKEDKK